MSFFALKTSLNAADRVERRRLIFSDTLSLATLFAITALLAVLTNYLYQSYASHQVALAARWLQRGDQALRDNKPQAAVDALSSALAYAPSDREHRDQAGRSARLRRPDSGGYRLLQCAVGNLSRADGLINLQLARLAGPPGKRKPGHRRLSKERFTATGRGTAMCAGGRFALSSSTISSANHRLDQARNELLVASGNAPEDDITVQLEIARIDGAGAGPQRRLSPVQGPSCAITLPCGRLWREPDAPPSKLGHYLEAKRYLARPLEGPATEGDSEANAAAARSKVATTRARQRGYCALSVFALEHT